MTTPPASGRSPAAATMPGPGGSTPIPVRFPVLVVGAGNRTATWLATLARLWQQTHPMTRLSAGPEEARASRARKTLIAEVLADAVNDHLAERVTDTLFVVDLTGAYGHTGRDDDDAAAAMGHAVTEAVRAARQVGGLPLVVTVDALADLPDTLRGFETVVTSAEPVDKMAEHLATPPTGSSRPAVPAPEGHVWIAHSGDDGWAPAPVTQRRGR